MPRDKRFPAAPCPTCRRAPLVTADQLGTVICCRECDTRFRAAPPPPLTQSIGSPAAPVEDDTRSADGNPYDDGYGKFEEEHTPGRVVALATMHFVYCGLLSVCGILSSVLLEVWPRALPGPDVASANRTIAHIVHGLMVAASVVLVTAGVLTLRRRPAGRGWTIVAMAVAGLLLLLNVGQMVLNLPFVTGSPGDASGIVFGVLYQFVYWLGYLVPVGALLAATTKRDREGADAS